MSVWQMPGALILREMGKVASCDAMLDFDASDMFPCDFASIFLNVSGDEL
jgi:hypothetical protein